MKILAEQVCQNFLQNYSFLSKNKSSSGLETDKKKTNISITSFSDILPF